MKAGDRVRVVTGMHGGLEGVVTSTFPGLCGQQVADVRLTVPELITIPDGPTRVVVLPFAATELEPVVTEPRLVNVRASEVRAGDVVQIPVRGSASSRTVTRVTAVPSRGTVAREMIAIDFEQGSPLNVLATYMVSSIREVAS